MTSRIYRVCQPLNLKNTKYSTILLNGPKQSSFLTPNQIIYWQQASNRITVDGGYNIFANQKAKPSNNFLKDPEFIFLGDSDSIRKEDCHFLKNQPDISSKIIKAKDQNMTDFEKCLKILQPNFMPEIYVLHWANIDRLDHWLSFFHTLNKYSHLKIQMVFENKLDNCTNILFCLPRNGTHKIEIEPEIFSQKDENKKLYCGLFAFSEKSGSAETSGLKYNLNFGDELGISGLCSSSNEIVDETVDINVGDRNLFFTVSIKA